MIQETGKKTMELRARKVCDDLRIKGIHRNFPAVGATHKVNLASNDYLGVVRRGLLNSSLAGHAGSLGTGGGSARLVLLPLLHLHDGDASRLRGGGAGRPRTDGENG